MATCPRCHGNGRLMCVYCSGKGTRSNGDPCPTCDATGSIVCGHCHGSGVVEH